MRIVLLAMVLLGGVGCGSTAQSTPADRSTSSTEDERAAAIAEAEAFVRAQGYTNTPPTVSGNQIVHEGIEISIEDRRDTLDPHAVYAAGADGEWSVIFRYRDPQYAERGRMLVLRPAQTPAFVHQDVVLSAIVPDEAP
jgi:hypothetical protein